MLPWRRMLHTSRYRGVHVRSMRRRGVQLREIDVRRFQLQGRRFVRRWRQPTTAPPSGHQHRVAMLMGMMPVIVLMGMGRLASTDRARASRSLLQTGRPVMPASIDVVNRARRSRWAGRSAPRT